MSLLSDLFARLTGRRSDAASSAGKSSAPPAKPAAGAATSSTPAKPASAASSPGTVPVPPTGAAAAPAPQAPTPRMDELDLAAHLDGLASKAGQKLNWRTSIVDMMKLVGMESSLSERKELAKELGYTGDMNDSATMNQWLHKQVLQRIASNGGKVPADLL